MLSFMLELSFMRISQWPARCMCDDAVARCGKWRFRVESVLPDRVGWYLKADVALRRISSSSFMACKRAGLPSERNRNFMLIAYLIVAIKHRREPAISSHIQS
jgi:hypothetical protein